MLLTSKKFQIECKFSVGGVYLFSSHSVIFSQGTTKAHFYSRVLKLISKAVSFESAFDSCTKVGMQKLDDFWTAMKQQKTVLFFWGGGGEQTTCRGWIYSIVWKSKKKDIPMETTNAN